MNGTRPSARKTGRTGSLTIKRVFVSSTTEDLRRAREKVCKTLLSMGLMPIAMDWFPSSPSTVKQRDDEKVQEADAFVILVGHRYGSSPHGGKKSYTELEYDAAWKSGKPLFPFLASEKFLPGRKRRERKEKRDRLLALRRRLTKRHSPRLFDSVDALCTEVSVALATLTGQADEETSRAARQGVAVAEALDGYVSDLVRDLSLWRGLGLGRNVRLEDTYVTHRIMDTSALGKPPLMPEEEVRKTFPDWDLLERLLGAEFQAKCLCITGPAGSGKTTLLRHWALTLAKQSPAQRVPIFLSLNFVGRLCGKGASLDVPLVQLVAQQFPDATGTVRDGLVQSLTSFVEVGRAPILLDGEDEIPEEARKAVWDWIYRLRRSAGQCPMVITSRNAQLGMVQSLTSGWEYFSLDGLDEDQQTDFITRWFAHSGDADSRENMMSQLPGPFAQWPERPFFS
jgi:energy-coupling factor transporter ATP-binding protein EcfA2